MDSSDLWKWIILAFGFSLSGETSSLCFAGQGKEVVPGVVLLTGHDLKLPELADPYATIMQKGAIISGTAQYYLRFNSIEDIRRGGPYQIEWNKFVDTTGVQIDGGWDLKPSLWTKSSTGAPELWNPARSTTSPSIVWYGGHMRAEAKGKTARWPDDNYSRDVFAFTQNEAGQWVGEEQSIFSLRADWPRLRDNYLGHRYGHQIVMVPRRDSDGKIRNVPGVFYEEVVEVREDGAPKVTKLFMDEMVSPLKTKGKPVELVSPLNRVTGKYYSSAVREDGAALVEGPLYFRFRFEGEEWEAIGFSAGSFYGRYPSCFAARRVSDGLDGKPYQIDLSDDGSDFHDASSELGALLRMVGGPGRPAVIVDSEGAVIPGPNGMPQVLLHGYREEIPPNSQAYPLDKKFRSVVYSSLKIERRPNGSLRFSVFSQNATLR